MQELDDKHIKLISDTVDRSGISYSHLREDMIDHICCEIESQLADGISFQYAFNSIRHNLGIKSLQQVQEKTLLLIDKNYCAMKSTMKVSGIISTILLIAGTLFKINHWPGGGIILSLGFVILCLVFLPSANYIMHRENRDRRTILMYLTAFLGLCAYFGGILFKVQHWPAAGILMMSGSLIMGFLFLPLLLSYLLKRAESGAEKFVDTIGIICAMLAFTGFLFKFMHWPGASLLLFADALLAALIFLPALTRVKYKKSEYVEVSFIYIIAAVSWLCITFLLVSLTTSGHIFEGFYTGQENIEFQKNSFRQTNDLVYSKALQSNHSAELEQVKILTEDLDQYIRSLKQEILWQNGDLPVEKSVHADHIDLSQMQNNSNTQAPYMVMLGESGQGKALELKQKLEETRTQFLKLVAHDSIVSKMIKACLNTELPEEVSGISGSWEKLYFDHTSVMACIEILSSLQRNLYIAEKEVITYLLNN